MDNPKQLFQDLRNGQLSLEEMIVNRPPAGQVLIETNVSLISPGTERMLTQFGRANLLEKARSQPEKVRQVMSKIKTEGIMTTLEKVRLRLGDPMPLGYSNVGRVIESGSVVGSDAFLKGDRVLSNGYHASVVCVPANLCARVPENVSDEEAVFGVLGAIALHGVRLLEPTLGENFAVFGLGAVGLMAVQLLRANGCFPLGLDTNPERVQLCQSLGIAASCVDENFDPSSLAREFNHCQGVDGALICASSDHVPLVDQAAQLCRKKARIVLTGVSKMEISRSLFFQKELKFQVSCSYGPGRYDDMYEQKGYDYPLAYVRWTEQRNFEAVLKMMEQKTLKVLEMISHRFPFEEAVTAYDQLNNGKNDSLGILLEYPSLSIQSKAHHWGHSHVAVKTRTEPGLTVIGTGLFAKTTMLPLLAKSGFNLCALVGGKTGGTQSQLAGKYGFKSATSDVDAAMNDPACQAVAILTRHSSHARYIIRALESQKAVYCEKPMCLLPAEWKQIDTLYRKLNDASLLIGYNRRFSPHIFQVQKFLKSTVSPRQIIMTINALPLPLNHWLLDVHEGGGRLMGEGCHFVDLSIHLCQDEVSSVYASYDNLTSIDSGFHLELKFKNGSVSHIHYLTSGTENFPKEQIDIFSGQKVCRVTNFRETLLHGPKGVTTFKTRKPDKGHIEMMQVWLNSLKQGAKPPIPYESISMGQCVLFACVDSLEKGRPVSMSEFMSDMTSLT